VVKSICVAGTSGRDIEVVENETPNFSYPSLIWRSPLAMFALEVRDEVNREETTVMWLSYSEGHMIVA